MPGGGGGSGSPSKERRSARGDRTSRSARSARRTHRTPRVWSAEEEEARDDYPLGSSEPPAARMPGPGALAGFRSGRQRPELAPGAQGAGDHGAAPEAVRSVLERTASLQPGQQFQK